MINKAAQKASMEAIQGSVERVSDKVDNVMLIYEKVDKKLDLVNKANEAWCNYCVTKFKEYSNEIFNRSIENIRAESNNFKGYITKREKLLDSLSDSNLSESEIQKINEEINKYEKLISKSAEDLIKKLDSLADQSNNIVSKIIQAIDDSKNKFSGNISEHIENFNNLINNLTLEKNLALVNFSGTFVIIITVINILFIFYGNKIIDYFNIEIRFPKLAFYINLRRKLQQYYLLWNIFVILVVSIIMFIINLLAFFI